MSHQFLQQGQGAVCQFPAIELVTLGQVSGQCYICADIPPAIHQVVC